MLKLLRWLIIQVQSLAYCLQSPKNEVFVQLIRTAPSISSQPGYLTCGKLKLATLELPWLDNETDRSCIPTGDYDCKALKNHTTSDGVTYEICFEVLNVQGRSGILIHPGNLVSQTMGCILVGSSFSYPYIVASRLGIRELYECVGDDIFTLSIRN